MVTSIQCINKYGTPNNQMEFKHMVLWDIPATINIAIPALPNKIYCNRDLKAPLLKAFQNIILRGLASEVKTWDGCFNIRKKRGGSSMSLHSWAIAVDLNAAWNGFGQTPQMKAALVKCFTDAGFEWGGNWFKKDGMHFQLRSI